MNWEAIGAIGELIGAVAVVATLAYLAIQIRQNTRSMDEARKVEMGRSAQYRTELRVGLFDSILQSEELLGVVTKFDGVEWPETRALVEELSPRERQAYLQLIRKQAIIVENLWSQGNSGLLDEELAQNVVPVMVRQAPLWIYLDAIRGCRPSFVAEVERLASEFPSE